MAPKGLPLPVSRVTGNTKARRGLITIVNRTASFYVSATTFVLLSVPVIETSSHYDCGLVNIVDMFLEGLHLLLSFLIRTYPLFDLTSPSVNKIKMCSLLYTLVLYVAFMLLRALLVGL